MLNPFIKEYHVNWTCPTDNMKDKLGRFRTLSLFYESLGQRQKGHYSPIYSLSNRDKTLEDGTFYPSAYLIYMASSDEYEAAIKLVGSMQHWRKLLETPWFLPGSRTWDWTGFEGLEQWRLDMEARNKSEAISLLREAAAGGNVQAQKELYKMGTESGKKPAGRPKKKRGEKSEEDPDINKLHDNIIGLNRNK